MPVDAFTIERHGEVDRRVASRPPWSRWSPPSWRTRRRSCSTRWGASRIPQIVVDLSAIDYFGSSFLGLLLRCWKLAQSRDGTMVLAGVSPRVRDLLHVTSLDMVWPIYGDLREAIEALQAD